jgi:hypothetical protein
MAKSANIVHLRGYCPTDPIEAYENWEQETNRAWERRKALMARWRIIQKGKPPRPASD